MSTPRPTARRLAALAVLAASAASACSSPGSPAAQPAPGPSAATPVSGSSSGPSSGTSSGTRAFVGERLRLELPTSPAFSASPPERRTDGVVVYRFRSQLAAGLACTVVANEQPGFTGRFPSGPQTSFAGAGVEDEVIANEPVPAPAGAKGELYQESRFLVRPDPAAGRPGPSKGHLYQRTVLTDDDVLVQVSAGEPDDTPSRCHAEQTVRSLRLL